ncbi:MAG: NAD-dependent epimerase/dehydratase family protein [Oscillospiraceae bacterium]|jgi:dihydroflavonol-4-reductase|nr:NAD-dependent epimerase/dehydratase family protein [Oscillospiraceae bacterium]
MTGLWVATGATGHIGYALAKHWETIGARYRLLLREHTPLFNGFHCGASLGDVTDRVSLEQAFTGAETVFHLAGLIEVNSGNEDATWKVNVGGTRNVIAACKSCGVKRLVYASSVDALPPLPEGQMMREIDRFCPEDVSGTYARTKALATQLVLDAAEPGFEVAVCHPGACVGPYDYKISNVGELVRMFLHGTFPVTMDFGGYNFVDVRDVALGMTAAADPAKAPSGSCYLLTGEAIACGDLIELLAELCGRKAPKLVLHQTLANTAAPVAEIYYKLRRQTPLFTRYSLRKLAENDHFSYEKAARELGYQPRGLRDSLTDMIAWIRENEPGHR